MKHSNILNSLMQVGALPLQLPSPWHFLELDPDSLNPSSQVYLALVLTRLSPSSTSPFLGARSLGQRTAVQTNKHKDHIYIYTLKLIEYDLTIIHTSIQVCSTSAKQVGMNEVNGWCVLRLQTGGAEDHFPLNWHLAVDRPTRVKPELQV